MKKNFFTKNTETIFVNTLWFLSFSMIFFFIENPYSLRDVQHFKSGKSHLIKGAHKDIPTQKTKININFATEQELIQLNGLGPKLSNRIVEYRKKNGPFSSIDGLLSVKGIGEKKLIKIKELIEV